MTRSFDDVARSVVALVEPLEAIEIPLLEAFGCAASADVRADADVPAFASAAVDGYAVRIEDVGSATTHDPRVVPVVGDVLPGEPPVVTVQPGFGARIASGAAVPVGTEAVVPTEWTDGGVARVAVTRAPEPGDNVIAPGSSVRAGDVVVASGTRLRSAHLGLLAASGLDRVAVRPRPRIVVMSVGSELVEPGSEILAGRWSESCGPYVTAALRDYGALAFRVPVIPSDARALTDTVEDQLVRADLVVLLDGAGAATRQLLRDVVGRLGTVTFDTVAADPLTTFGYGTVGPDATPILVPPSDPLASFVAAETFLRPVVRRMLGLEPLHHAVVRAVLRGTIGSSVGVRTVVPAELDVEDGVYVVRPIHVAGHGFGAASAANALVAVPEALASCADGQTVEVVVLERQHA